VRVAPSVTLSSEKRRRLESLARGRSTPHRLVLRAQIVLRAADGAQNKQIAKELGTQRNTCVLWRNRFHRLRLAGIEQDVPRPGGPLRLPDVTIRAIVHDTLHTKPPNATHWSTRSTAEKFGVSPNTVHQIWTERRIQPHRLEHYKLSRDKRFEEKLRDVVGLYLNPPEHALVPAWTRRPRFRRSIGPN
jgi:transposase